MFLCEHLVSRKESLDSHDTDWDEFLPWDHHIFIFFSKRYHSTDIILGQLILQVLEGVIEFLISETPCIFCINVFEKFNKSSFERWYKSWRIDIDFLTLIAFISKVLHFCDIKVRYKWVHLLPFSINKPSCFKLSSQVKFLLDFVFVFEDASDPRLKHHSAHTIIQFVF